MFKKTLAGLTALVIGTSCYAPQYRPDKIFIGNRFTKESAKATLQELLRNREERIVQIMAGPEQPCCLRDCVVNDEKISCSTICWRGSNPTRYPPENYEPTIEYHQVEEMMCHGNRAGVYLKSPLQAKEIIFSDETDCQQFVDALTYLKN